MYNKYNIERKKKYVYTACILIMQSLLEWFRVSYIINFTNARLPFLINRIHSKELRKSINAENGLDIILADPRILSSIIITILNISLTLTLVLVNFGKKNALNASYVIGGLLVTMTALAIVSIYTKQYNNGLDTVEDLKVLIQSPLLGFILLIVFYASSKLYPKA